jgi:tetratricopeptide (TPR) repeat protein
LFAFCLSLQGLCAQKTEALAKQYYENAEYEKAAELYDELLQKSPQDILLYDRYLSCLLFASQTDKAAKFVSKRKKKYPDQAQYRVDEGYVLEKQGKIPDAEKAYKKAMDFLLNEPAAYYETAEAFRRRNKYSWIVKTFELGEAKFGAESDFSSLLAQIYMETGERQKALEKYVQMVVSTGYAYEQSKQLFEMNVTDSADFVILRSILLKQLQKDPDRFELNDLLKWTFIKTKDWNSAFVQTKALDKRLREKGQRVIELGELCVSNEAWGVATQCFEYTKGLGKEEPFYAQAVSGLLETRFKLIETSAAPLTSEINTLETEMLGYLKEYGNTDQTWKLANRLSDLYTRYIHQPEKAVTLLEGFYKSYNLSKKTQAAAKLALGDAYVISEDVWSSELLFAQVEKDFPEDAIGQEAKFRRARLSYYRGDFEWAVIQLDALKGATTQLISNNAIRLALTISENLGIDSNYDALSRFSNAELLITQNKLELAEKELDSIPKLYPGHSLSDDILLQKAIIREKQARYADAAELYNTLAIAFGHDILADNAWFNLGLLYEYKLGDKENARKAYEKIVNDFPGSLFIIEARERFRKLRGDNI